MNDNTPPNIIEVDVPGKPWWKSKTIWVNVAFAVLSIVVLVFDGVAIPPGAIALIVCGVNVVLRHFTMQPLTVGGPQTMLVEVDSVNKTYRLLH